LKPDPKDRPVARHAVVRDRLRSLRIVLGLFLLLGLSSMIGASRTASPSQVQLHMGLWFAAQCAAIAASVAALRWLRRRRFDRPSSTIPRTSDGLVYIAATVGGALALAAFSPRVFLGPGAALDWLIVVIGLVLLVAGLRGAALYLLRP